MENRVGNGRRARGDLGGQRPPARHGQPQPQCRHGWGCAGSGGVRHAGAGGERRQEDDPDLSRLCRPHRADPQHHAAGQSVGLSAGADAADGADVRQGDLLYRIAPDDFQAALDQAKAQVQRDTATLDYARSNLGRGTELAKSGYLAKDSFDQRTSTLREAEASLALNQAAVRTAELNLSYAEIRAPFAGRLGRNQASVGTLVSVAGTVLNTLVQLDPIYVTFNPSETDLTEIEQARAAGPVEVEVLLPGETEASQKGELTFIDNTVDRSTGTITARATIGNAKFTLLPGQYVRVRLHVRQQPDALMVPQTALGSSQLGKYLYVVGKGNTVDQRWSRSDRPAATWWPS